MTNTHTAPTAPLFWFGITTLDRLAVGARFRRVGECWGGLEHGAHGPLYRKVSRCYYENTRPYRIFQGTQTDRQFAGRSPERVLVWAPRATVPA